MANNRGTKNRTMEREEWKEVIKSDSARPNMNVMKRTLFALCALLAGCETNYVKHPVT